MAFLEVEWSSALLYNSPTQHHPRVEWALFGQINKAQSFCKAALIAGLLYWMVSYCTSVYRVHTYIRPLSMILCKSRKAESSLSK